MASSRDVRSTRDMRKHLEPRGFRVHEQMETAREMELTEKDLQRLYRRFPDRYRDLLVALGVPLPGLQE